VWIARFHHAFSNKTMDLVASPRFLEEIDRWFNDDVTGVILTATQGLAFTMCTSKPSFLMISLRHHFQDFRARVSARTDFRNGFSSTPLALSE